jgi:hypothetical protein
MLNARWRDGDVHIRRLQPGSVLGKSELQLSLDASLETVE